MSGIYEKLAEVQKVLGVVVGRDQVGQVGSRKYTYAGLQGVLEKVVPVLRDRGLVLVERIVGNTLTISIVDYAPDEPGELELIESVYPLPDTKDAQAFGSAITYGRRYTITTMLGLVAGDDDDGAAATAQTKPRPEPSSKKDTDQLADFITLVSQKLVKLTDVKANTAPDFAEGMIEEWGILRERTVRPLTGDTANDAWRDIAAAIEAGVWDHPAFGEFVTKRAPF